MALIAAMAVLAFVLIMGMASLALADRSVNQTVTNRNALKAEAAAEAAVDIAAYRLAKSITGQGAQGLISLNLGATPGSGGVLENVQTLACLTVSAGSQYPVLDTGSVRATGADAARPFCPLGAWEDFEDLTQLNSSLQLQVDAADASGGLIIRRIVGLGRSGPPGGETYRRVIAEYQLQLGAAGGAGLTELKLFRRRSFAVCKGSWDSSGSDASRAGPTRPSLGCPKPANLPD